MKKTDSLILKQVTKGKQIHLFVQRSCTNGHDMHVIILKIISQRKMEIKITRRFHFTSTRGAKRKEE